ncbi:hypothetical protein PCC7424_5411 (plasmid) [Gloeothece citriformis PCC 7424]|uniref:C-type lysozyme inhibitor domain-containing protein n=1 Tax=Gloeothece citriformis (strain PCC 7424) TaxID=65393 RepID=B7KMG7_GLOC7|nr:hypothetical protein [Gloeothece citriformis]ACK73989.1 hypothetical protein PCC7424_5411 [Gloeothece citriformis PCC 7424]
MKLVFFLTLFSSVVFIPAFTKVNAEPLFTSKPSQMIANGKNVGTATCASIINEGLNTRPIQKATLEARGNGYRLKFTELMRGKPSETVWELDSQLIIYEAESDGMSWNLTSYNREPPVTITPTGNFEIEMMVSSRSWCIFTGTLQFIGNAKAQLFPNSTTLPEAANLTASSDSLCSKDQMPLFVIRTEDFDAEICGKLTMIEPLGCEVPSEPYFYVSQSRKTGQSIVLPATNATQEDPFMIIYKAKNGNLTYQMASSGGYVNKPWTSLSVFENGKRIYHRKVNKYDGLYDC